MMPVAAITTRPGFSRRTMNGVRFVAEGIAGSSLLPTRQPPHTGVLRHLSISRMLDMEGAPSAANDRTLIRTVNASKNSKLQAVAFDFEILVKAAPSTDASTSATNNSAPTITQLNTRPQADEDRVKQVASLLNVDMNSEGSFKNPYKEERTPSISSLADSLMGGWSSSTSKPQSPPKPSSPTLKSNNPLEDIRAKYAKKLKGGLAGIELAKSQVEDALSKGDAAGHLAARKIAMQQPPKAATKWMANFGASKLLTHLTHRSIRIALLPSPNSVGDAARQAREQENMHDLTTQLKDVVIDVRVPSLADKEGSTIVTSLKQHVLQEFNLDPGAVLLVSDRDDYLRAAKELGMLTCRLQPKNARRGNIAAHYTSPSVEEVQEVVNEINGISFNVVLNR